MYICFGAHIDVVCLDPNLGGTIILVDNAIPPMAGLPMGYLFNIIIGGLLIYCGFDTLASKIASFVGLAWFQLARRMLGSSPTLLSTDGGFRLGWTFLPCEFDNEGIHCTRSWPPSKYLCCPLRGGTSLTPQVHRDRSASGSSITLGDFVSTFFSSVVSSMFEDDASDPTHR